MDKFEINEQVIDAFLKGQLKDEQLNHFNRELLADPELAFEVEKQKEVVDGLTVLGNDAFRQKLRNIQTEVEQEEKNKLRQLKTLKWMGVAASVLFSLALLSWLLFSGSNKQEKIYASQYSTPTLSSNVRGAESNQEIIKGIELFEAAKYSQSIQVLSSQDHSSSISGQGLFALATSYMEVEDFDNAILTFQKVIEQNDPFYINSAKWYTALAYLRIDKEQEAINILNNLKEQDHSFRSNAEKVLELIAK